MPFFYSLFVSLMYFNYTVFFILYFFSLYFSTL